MLEALYRHLSSEGVDFQGILESHLVRSGRRVAKATTDVYVAHDTTAARSPESPSGTASASSTARSRASSPTRPWRWQRTGSERRSDCSPLRSSPARALRPSKATKGEGGTVVSPRRRLARRTKLGWFTWPIVRATRTACSRSSPRRATASSFARRRTASSRSKAKGAPISSTQPRKRANATRSTCQSRNAEATSRHGRAGARHRHVPARRLRTCERVRPQRTVDRREPTPARGRGAPLLARPDGRDREARDSKLGTGPFAPARSATQIINPVRRGRADGRALTARRRRGRSMIGALRTDPVDRTLAALHRACRRRAAARPQHGNLLARRRHARRCRGVCVSSPFRHTAPGCAFVRRRAR